ncbi:MAG TPA: hypothetical protein VII06_11395 [Chloroflexota bacterium]|jgi:anti-sigma factor RsiW
MRTLLALAALLAAILPGVASAAPADQGPPGGGNPVPVATSPGSGLVIQSDMVIGAPGPCALQSRFHPGDRVVFRAKVYDAATGQLVPGAQTVVHLEDGTTLDMRYEAHPPPNVGPSSDEYWVAVWAIRPDAPMGIVRYSIDATDGGRTGHFEPFENMTSLLTVVPAES